ncbi:MAG: hypothetical protein ACI31C_06970 [Muribaculaceae bacterium]
MKSPYKYQFTPRYYHPDGGYHDAHSVYLHDDSTMFDAIFMGIDMARELGTDVLFFAYSPYAGWQYIHTSHPDGTATNAFGNRQRFTGDRLKYWEPVTPQQ